jgi:hypothetical protein
MLPPRDFNISLNFRFPILYESDLHFPGPGVASAAKMTADQKLHAAVTLADFASSCVIDIAGTGMHHSDRR